MIQNVFLILASIGLTYAAIRRDLRVVVRLRCPSRTPCLPIHEESPLCWLLLGKRP